MSRTRLRNSLVIITVGFIVSWVVTQPLFSAWRDSNKIIQPPPTATLPSVQGSLFTTYALVWIDDIAKPMPVVDGVWVAWVPSDYSKVQITGLPPVRFQGQYSPVVTGIPPDSLGNDLRGVFGGSLVLDRPRLRNLVDQLGGIYLNGQKLDGPAVVNFFVQAEPNAAATDVLIRQGAVVQALLAQMAIVGKGVELPALLAIPDTKVDRNVLLDVVRHYYPLDTEAVQVMAKPLAISGTQP